MCKASSSIGKAYVDSDSHKGMAVFNCETKLV